jgi:hypothetical protein
VLLLLHVFNGPRQPSPPPPPVVQQGWPGRPHVVHTSLMQLCPAVLHAGKVFVQQASPSPPHAVHVLLAQSRPVAQPFPPPPPVLQQS